MSAGCKRYGESTSQEDTNPLIYFYFFYRLITILEEAESWETSEQIMLQECVCMCLCVHSSVSKVSTTLKACFLFPSVPVITGRQRQGTNLSLQLIRCDCQWLFACWPVVLRCSEILCRPTDKGIHWRQHTHMQQALADWNASAVRLHLSDLWRKGLPLPWATNQNHKCSTVTRQHTDDTSERPSKHLHIIRGLSDFLLSRY